MGMGRVLERVSDGEIRASRKSDELDAYALYDMR